MSHATRAARLPIAQIEPAHAQLLAEDLTEVVAGLTNLARRFGLAYLTCVVGRLGVYRAYECGLDGTPDRSRWVPSLTTPEPS